MSLPILVAIVVIGISLSVAAVHFTGGTRTARLASEAEARAAFARDYPDIVAGAVRLAGDGTGALLVLGDGRIGVLSAIGDRFLTRIVAPGSAALTANGRVVALRVADISWPGRMFELTDAAAASAIAAAFAAPDTRKAA